jgi:hypothetical protein
MTEDPNNGANGNQLKRRRSLTSLLFPAVENLSNEPSAIVLSCANAAACTSVNRATEQRRKTKG